MHKIELLPGEPVMIMTRMFDAPRELVWRTFAEPEHRVNWWGPHGYTNKVTEWDLRPGGKWRVVTILPKGEEIAFIGEFREVVKPERMVHTFGMENMWEGKTSLETHEFEERDGKTFYKATSVFDSMESRDGMMASGMEKGVTEGFERLDEILEGLKAET
jgi:uncharacterized protein YndB with AHSA1/START domain